MTPQAPPTPRDALLADLRSILPPDRVLADPAELFVYESDGFTVAHARPAAVVFPASAEEARAVLGTLVRHGAQVVPRGSGTGLAGGCVAYGDGVVVSTVRMDRILDIDLPGRTATVEAGVRNTALTDAVALKGSGFRVQGSGTDVVRGSRLDVGRSTFDGKTGTSNVERRTLDIERPSSLNPASLHFAPDPSSQRASTIGGNAATNAGGIHTLKDFVSSNHVLGLDLALSDGSLVHLGARDGCYERGPFDLPGLVCGSEGTFGLITALTVRLTPKATSFRTMVATFSSAADACNAISDIIAAGHLPSAMEMMDGAMVAVVEDAFHFGFRREAQALVLIEIDGIDDLLDAQLADIAGLCNRHDPLSLDSSADPDRRAALWKARKGAFGAIGRISHSYCTQDACVPRSMLADVLAEIDRIGGEHGLKITNVFHAGDGNVHPIFLYDERDEAQVQNVLRAALRILQHCIDVGGTLTGEHGVGVEKLHLMPYLFDRPTLEQFRRVKDAFDPLRLFNEGKLIPSDKVKVTLLKPGRHVPQ